MACDAQSATAESARAELRAARQDIDNLQAALAEMEAQRSSVRGHALDKCALYMVTIRLICYLQIKSGFEEQKAHFELDKAAQQARAVEVATRFIQLWRRKEQRLILNAWHSSVCKTSREFHCIV